MSPSLSPSVVSVLLLSATCAPVSSAGACERGWKGIAAGAPAGPVLALETFDPDGSGPTRTGLIVAGSFTMVGSAMVSNIARWDGNSWFPLGSGVSAEVRALTRFDADGAGPGEHVLIAAGLFNSAGGAPADLVAAWNGSSWSALGSGLTGAVSAVVRFDPDDVGPAPVLLIAAGRFSLQPASPLMNLAKWDGVSWSALPDGLPNNDVVSLAAFDADGQGPLSPRLVVGGWFTQVGSLAASRVVTWDGQTWSPLGTGLAGPFPLYARALTQFDPDGPGPAPISLYVGGFFDSAGGVSALGLARWDGQAWQQVAGGIGYPAECRTLLVADDDGSGPSPTQLFAGGSFLPLVGAPGNNVAAWDGQSWKTLAGGTNQVVSALALFDEDGDGPDPAGLYVAGNFTAVDGTNAPRLARWGCPRAPTDCPDANSDGRVDFGDITAVLAGWGTGVGVPPVPGDANRDGFVNFADITAILGGWGVICR